MLLFRNPVTGCAVTYADFEEFRRAVEDDPALCLCLGVVIRKIAEDVKRKVLAAGHRDVAALQREVRKILDDPQKFAQAWNDCCLKDVRGMDAPKLSCEFAEHSHTQEHFRGFER